MRIAYTTTFDAREVSRWSGTPYFMSRAFADAGVGVDYIGSLQQRLPRFYKFKQAIQKWKTGLRESPRFNLQAAKYYAQQVSQQLNNLKVDAVVAPLINPIAYLDCKQPIVLWTDAVHAGLLGFYNPHRISRSIAQGNILFEEGLARCKLAIFSSAWGARSALELHGTSREKVKVVPFGANIDSAPSWEEVRTLIKKRPTDKIKLLFLAKEWERKGGDIALAVAKMLHEAGHAVELTIVGYEPALTQPLPYVNCLGFISKHTVEGQNRIKNLLADTHFLFVPSRAEAFGIVFCEANAFGVPCLTTYVGGIESVIKDNVNGMTFALDIPLSTYCDYIVQLMSDRLRYETLALSAYNEYVTRLNWRSAIQQVRSLIEAVL